jgi:hypothetical protein
MADKLPKYRRGIGTGRNIAPKSGVPAGVTMLSQHNIALDILSIPAMSDEPERVFSGARRTISWENDILGEGTNGY